MADIELTKSESLAAVEMFSGLDEVGLWHLSSLATEVAVPAGTVLLQPGQEGQGLFVILDGEVVVELPGGTHVTCAAGEFIGELSLLVDGLVHTGRVRAKTPVNCLAISRDDFARLLDTYPQIAVSMLRVLARRLADTDAMLSARSH
jgi:CRP/FNR family cyclic AMP-dependent transcriptional regulator